MKTLFPSRLNPLEFTIRLVVWALIVFLLKGRLHSTHEFIDPILRILGGLVLLYPIFAIIPQRIKDMGLSILFIFLLAIPVVNVVFLISLFFLRTDRFRRDLPEHLLKEKPILDENMEFIPPDISDEQR